MSTTVLAPTVVTMLVPGIPTVNTMMVRMRMPFSGVITGATIAMVTAPSGATLLGTLKVGSDTAATFSAATTVTSDDATLTSANCDFAAGDLVSWHCGATNGSAENITIAFTCYES